MYGARWQVLAKEHTVRLQQEIVMRDIRFILGILVKNFSHLTTNLGSWWKLQVELKMTVVYHHPPTSKDVIHKWLYSGCKSKEEAPKVT